MKGEHRTREAIYEQAIARAPPKHGVALTFFQLDDLTFTQIFMPLREAAAARAGGACDEDPATTVMRQHDEEIARLKRRSPPFAALLFICRTDTQIAG